MLVREIIGLETKSYLGSWKSSTSLQPGTSQGGGLVPSSVLGSPPEFSALLASTAFSLSIRAPSRIFLWRRRFEDRSLWSSGFCGSVFIFFLSLWLDTLELRSFLLLLSFSLDLLFLLDFFLCGECSLFLFSAQSLISCLICSSAPISFSSQTDELETFADSRGTGWLGGADS